MQWVSVRVRARDRVRVRVKVKVMFRVRVRVSVSCAFSEAFVGIAVVGIAAFGIAACTHIYGAREGTWREKIISCARDAISCARDNFFFSPCPKSFPGTERQRFFFTYTTTIVSLLPKNHIGAMC